MNEVDSYFASSTCFVWDAKPCFPTKVTKHGGWDLRALSGDKRPTQRVICSIM